MTLVQFDLRHVGDYVVFWRVPSRGCDHSLPLCDELSISDPQLRQNTSRSEFAASAIRIQLVVNGRAAR